MPSFDWPHPTPWADVHVNREPLEIGLALTDTCPDGHRIGRSGGWLHCAECRTAWPVNEHVYDAAMERAVSPSKRLSEEDR